MKDFFTLKIPVFYLLFLVSISMFSTFLMTTSYYNLNKSFVQDSYDLSVNRVASCDYSIKRLGGYNYIKPLLYVDRSCETGIFVPMKQRILDLIENDKLQGKIADASVFVRDFNKGDFMAINENTPYKAGSLMNVPLLITYLHMDENFDKYLNKELLLEHAYPNKLNTANKTQVGKKYSLKNLLELMIINQDNNATQLLYENVDRKAFTKTFTDLGLTAPESILENCSLSAYEITLFLRTLYNATYLTINNSEYATKLLSEGEENSLSTTLQSSVKMAKSNSFIKDSNLIHLHESSIIYLNNYPYIITVMTKGNDAKQLSKVVKQITTTVYTEIVAKKQPKIFL